MDPTYQHQMEEEEIDIALDVKDTNMEALKAKKSAITKGYLVDPFVKYIVKKPIKKEIIINRGYWARTYTVQEIQKRFLTKLSEDDTTERQILNFGCGYDTFVFNLFHNREQYAKFKYFESDLDEVVIKKVKMIKKTKELHDAFKGEKLEYDSHGHSIKSECYGLIDIDLTKPKEIDSRLKELGVDFTKPTLVFTECVLAYIEKQPVYDYMKYLRENFSHLVVVDYEMFNPNDAFGKVMVRNFESRGCSLAGIEFFNSLKDIKSEYDEIFADEDSTHTFEILDMNDVTKFCIDQKETTRIMTLEFLDEYEEFWLMMGHYFMSMLKFNKDSDDEEEKEKSKIIEQLKFIIN